MWNDQDAANLRAFLSTATGQNLMQELLDSRPTTNGRTIESYALSAAKKEGWEEEFIKIEALSKFKEQQLPESPYIDTTPLDK